MSGHAATTKVEMYVACFSIVFGLWCAFLVTPGSAIALLVTMVLISGVALADWYRTLRRKGRGQVSR